MSRIDLETRFNGEQWQVWFYENKTLYRQDGVIPGMGKTIIQVHSLGLEKAEDLARQMAHTHFSRWARDSSYPWTLNIEKCFAERVFSAGPPTYPEPCQEKTEGKLAAYDVLETLRVYR